MTAVPMCPRSFVSTLMPTPQPPCNGPSNRSAGSETSVKNTSSNSADPVICRSGRTSIPGRSIGHRKNEMPSCLRASGSVRAIRMPQLLTRPPEHHTFWPLTTKRSPSRSARVASDPRSLPAPGSENSWHQTCSAVSVGAQVLALLLGRAVLPDRPAGQHQADHVEHGRHPGAGALDQPRLVVVDAESPATVLDRPVDPGVARLVQASLPRHAGVDQLGRADRPVVGRGMPRVRRRATRGRRR